MKFNFIRVTFQIMLLILIGGLFSTPAQARPIGKIRSINSVVEMRMGEKGSWKKATNGTGLEKDQYIRCGAKGQFILNFVDDSSALLKSGAHVHIENTIAHEKPFVLRILGSSSQVVVRTKGKMQVRVAMAKAAPQ